ncbi:MAG TPA: VWA domain-containing protein [Vicinamibacterales bacterium]|nr:VWA domain-containing protein [Vicinamibacterales bacterium]
MAVPLIAVDALLGAEGTTDSHRFDQGQVFRAEANLVEISAVVVNQRGERVSGLKREDFEVLEDGRPQQLAQFLAVDLKANKADATDRTFGGFRDTLAPLDLASNDVEGRAYAIVLDYFHLAPEEMPRVRSAVRQFVEGHLGEHDTACVVRMSYSPYGSLFTTDRKQLLRLAGITFQPGSLRTQAGDDIPVQDAEPTKLAPIREPNLGMALDLAMAADATERSLEELGRVAEYLGQLRFRRKTVLLFSQGIGIDLLGGYTGTSPGIRGASDRAARALKEFVAAATRNDVTVYAIDARGLSAVTADSPGTRRAEWDSLRILSRETGGDAVLAFNQFDVPFSRIVDDSSRYYVLGYYTKVRSTNKDFHALKVRTIDPQLTVRTRTGFYGNAAIHPAVKATNGKSTQVDKLLAYPLPVSDGGLHLAISASVAGRTGGRGMVQVALEVNGSELLLDREGRDLPDNEVEIAYAALDDVEKTVSHGAKRVSFKRSDESWPKIVENGWRYLAVVPVPAGAHQLRLAARETKIGRFGSVFIDVRVPDPSAQPIAMGSLMLSTNTAALKPTIGDVAIPRPIFEGPPIASREFSASDAISVFAPVLASGPSGLKLELECLVRSSGGAVVWRSGVSNPVDLRAGGHAFTIPAESLSPGRYLLAVVASWSGSRGLQQQTEFFIR